MAHGTRFPTVAAPKQGDQADDKREQQNARRLWHRLGNEEAITPRRGAILRKL